MKAALLHGNVLPVELAQHKLTRMPFHCGSRKIRYVFIRDPNGVPALLGEGTETAPKYYRCPDLVRVLRLDKLSRFHGVLIRHSITLPGPGFGSARTSEACFYK